MLVRYFIDTYCQQEGREPLVVAPEVWRWLNSHSWPGNVRERESLCQRLWHLVKEILFDIDVLALTGSLFSGSPWIDKTGGGSINNEWRGQQIKSKRGRLHEANNRVARELLEKALAEYWKCFAGSGFFGN